MVPTARAPRWSSIEELGTGEGHEQGRDVNAWLHREIEQLEEAVARPVQVLEGDDEGAASGGRFEEHAPRREQLARDRRLGRRHADRRTEQIGDTCSVGNLQLLE